MAGPGKPPASYRELVRLFPKLGEAWDLAREAEAQGPLPPVTRRLLKLAIAAGAMREGAVRSAVRKALAEGATKDEVLQIVALSATTIGFPSAVAVYSWIAPLLDEAP